MSKTVYDLPNYEDLKAQYEDSQRQLKQTEQLLIHLTQIKKENRIPHKANYVDRMLNEQYEKYEIESQVIHELKQQLNLLKA
ncbi:MAG: hypothetical protein ACLTXC_11090 [Turicibacter sp.]|uniref:hypothetical protein n=1 Tax=Turicibacter bilis TaxID=2735723 RepID=UPI0006BEEBAE|nr:Uncharacterised protein [Turicibacter sanguinis]